MPTTGRPKNTSGPTTDAGVAALGRPVAPAVWAKAKGVADRYQITLWSEDGEWYGRGVELAMTMADGPTPTACVAAVREAFAAVVAHMLETGEPVPAPAGENRRTEQVNVRLTAAEKAALEAAAQESGFRGVSDFVRAASLDRAGKGTPAPRVKTGRRIKAGSGRV